MLNTKDIMETINMIQEENLDIRTITMGISLLDCIDPDPDAACRKIYDKIMKKAGKLVQVGEEIEKEYGVPIITSGFPSPPSPLSAPRLVNPSNTPMCWKRPQWTAG